LPAHGFEPEPLDLRGRSPHAEMLAEYGDVDIALDPFPFCGGLTSCEALWMGVPVVTLPGSRPGSRQTLALLTPLGPPTPGRGCPSAGSPSWRRAIRRTMSRSRRGWPVTAPGWRRFARACGAA